MSPELNVKRAVFVLGKIDEILAWDKDQAHERDLRFVDGNAKPVAGKEIFTSITFSHAAA